MENLIFIELVLLTKISENYARCSKLSTMFHLLEIIAYQNRLNMNSPREFNKTIELLYKQVKEN